jgi:hypothetical protein
MAARELRVERGDGVTLVASLALPDRIPAPALVALHGALAATRNYPLFEHVHPALPPAAVAVVTSRPPAARAPRLDAVCRAPSS